MNYRKTYVKINLQHIENNVKLLIQKNAGYQYYFGVVKADCYGHYGPKPIQAMIDGGCNYLAVSSLDEAIAVRKFFEEIPILCLEPIAVENLKVASQYHITITVGSMNYLKELENVDDYLTVHIKVNTGMNRLGFSHREEITKAYYRLIQKENIKLEGIYTHIYDASDEERTNRQFELFQKFTASIPLKNIPIVHLTASDATTLYPKLSFANGCRFGISMYGFTLDQHLKLQSTFQVVSEVIQIQTLQKGDCVGYDGIYQATTNGERIAVVSIGYADGIVRSNTGRYVYIHNKKYPIVGNICMDMLFVKVDESVVEHDEAIVIKDVEHIYEIAKFLNTICHEVMCNISKRVPRLYKE